MKKLIKSLVKAVLPHSAYDSLLPLIFRIHIIKSYIKIYLKVKFSDPSKARQEKINFGFHLVEHCNLNCASCNNFTPLAEAEFLDFEDFKRDIERMGILFSHECDQVRLLGGEPMLHPEIIKFLKTARENFHSGKIALLTNGILLTQQKPEFWRACHDYGVTIEVTHYPVNIDVPKIKSLAEDFGVELLCSEVPISTFFKMPVNLSGNGDYKVNFYACDRANHCPLIYHGKLFTCTFAPNIRHFNKKFGVNIPVTEADCIDIYEETSGENILRRLCDPIPICRFCNMNITLLKWHRSEYKINEWV